MANFAFLIYRRGSLGQKGQFKYGHNLGYVNFRSNEVNFCTKLVCIDTLCVCVLLGFLTGAKAQRRLSSALCRYVVMCRYVSLCVGLLTAGGTGSWDVIRTKAHCVDSGV